MPARSSWERLLLVLPVILAVSCGSDEDVESFPQGFAWGTAVSAFQTEMGGDPSANDEGTDWWVWVHDPENIEAGVTSGDLPEDGPGSYELFRDDLRAARELHNNAFRLSLEWSRIFPVSTATVDVRRGISLAVLRALDALADQAAVTHYREVLEAIREEGLEPMVTLNHFTLPLWVHDPLAVRDAFRSVDPLGGTVPANLVRAGWLDTAIVEEFSKYAAYCAWRFGDLVDLWATINEPLVVLVSGFVNVAGVGGNFPPGVFNLAATVTAMPQLVEAHTRAYDALRTWDGADADGDGAAAVAGIVANLAAFHPTDPANPLDVEGVAHARYLFNEMYLNATIRGDLDADLDGVIEAGEHRTDLEARMDFIGVNYYQRIGVTGLGSPLSPLLPLFDFLPTLTYQGELTPEAPPCPTECSDVGSEIYPPGIRAVLEVAGSYGLPLFITENGMADADDDQRARYLVRHLLEVRRAIADGVADVRGYYHWSLIDNFEWVSGYGPQFGLYRVDSATKERIPRESAELYASVAERGGLEQWMVERYGP